MKRRTYRWDQQSCTPADIHTAHQLLLWLQFITSWTIRTSFAPRSRQIMTPAPHHSIFFTERMLYLTSLLLPSVLWHCWLGGRKGIRPVKNERWWRWALVSPADIHTAHQLLLWLQFITSWTICTSFAPRSRQIMTPAPFFTERMLCLTSLLLPSVLWHCWLGGRKGIRPVKKWEMVKVGTG